MTIKLFLTTLVCTLFVISLFIGPAHLPISDSLVAIFSDQGMLTLIMYEIRLPRALLAALIGAGLGLSGAAMQCYLRNPLAEPGIIGISSTAALGAIIALQTGFAASFAFALPLSALLAAAIGVFIVLRLSGPTASSLTLILAGVAVSAFSGALLTLVLNLSPNPFAVYEVIFWMMGSVADRSMQDFWLILPFLALGAFLLLKSKNALDALTLGEDAAHSLGINMHNLRLVIIFGTACIVGASTAIAGAIGFVGLVVPHILRPLVKAQPSQLLPISALGGAALLLSADIFIRVVFPTKDLKLGVITALLGAPLFLHLIVKLRKGQAS